MNWGELVEQINFKKMKKMIQINKHILNYLFSLLEIDVYNALVKNFISLI